MISQLSVILSTGVAGWVCLVPGPFWGWVCLVPGPWGAVGILGAVGIPGAGGIPGEGVYQG